MRPSNGSFVTGLALASLLAACVQFQPIEPVGTGAEGPAPAEASGRTGNPELYWRMIGQSVQGRPLRTRTIGHGPRRVLWIGGIHGNEREGSVATAELPDAFTAVPGALAEVTLTVLEDVNPDGTALGVRGNANGVDLNRNYPAANFKPHRMYGISPLSQPESCVLHDLILELQPHLVIVAHSWRGDRFINPDGPATDLAERFSRLSSYPLRQSDSISPTPGSLGSWVGYTLGIPILTLEYLRGRDPWEAWDETKAAILAVVFDS